MRFYRTDILIFIFLGLLSCGAAAAEIPQFGIFEFSAAHSQNYSNPYQQVYANAVFTRPDGKKWEIPAFWDGNDVWKIRISPDITGKWTFQIQSSDPCLSQVNGSFTCVTSQNKGSITTAKDYPYHFQYQNSEPFWFMGDTNFALFSDYPEENHTAHTVLKYIDTRRQSRFNVIQCSVVNDRGNLNGTAFSSNQGKLSVNPKYWQELERRLKYANSKGITVGLIAASAQNWKQFPSEQAKTRFIRYLVARLSAFDVYFVAGTQFEQSSTKENYDSVCSKIDNLDPHGRLITVHSISQSPSAAQFQYLRSFSYLNKNILEKRDHAKPVVNAKYASFFNDKNGDGIYDFPNSSSIDEIRHATWDIAMAGGYFITAFGNTFNAGKNNWGNFDPDNSKYKPWLSQAENISKLFTSTQWWKLHPHNELIESDTTAYCLAEPARQYVIYIRNAASEAKLDLTRCHGTYTAQLFDPRTGNFYDAPSDKFANVINLLPPDNQDWVFVLKRQDIDKFTMPTFSLSADKTKIKPGAPVELSCKIGGKIQDIKSISWNFQKSQKNVELLLADLAGIKNDTLKITRSFNEQANYKIYLTAQVADCDYLSISNPIFLEIRKNFPPQLEFISAVPNFGPAPLRVELSASAYDIEGQKVSYTWDLDGDGEFDRSGAIISTSYNKPGKHKPVLKVSDPNNSQVIEIEINVKPRNN